MHGAKFIPDELDRRIIAHLRADGRAPLAKLADALGVARGTVQNRLDRLLETGTLLGFTVRVREDYEDRSIRAVMLIEVTGKSTATSFPVLITSATKRLLPPGAAQRSSTSIPTSGASTSTGSRGAGRGPAPPGGSPAPAVCTPATAPPAPRA